MYIHDLNTFINKSVPIDNNTEVKNKILLSLNDENFIIFEYKNNENSFLYKIYTIIIIMKIAMNKVVSNYITIIQKLIL